MSTNTIGFYEREYTNDPERAGLHKTVQGIGLLVAHKWAEQVNSGIPTILFFHGNDRSDLGTPESSGTTYRAELSGVLKVKYGGNDSSQDPAPWDENLESGYINWQSVRDGIAGFVKDVHDLAKLDKDAVRALITKHFFDIDPELEELLRPFATSSPFKAVASEAKAKLDAHIAKKLPKSKS